MAELSGNLQERMLKVLESIHTPQSYVWNAILLLEQAKSSLSEDWICNKSLILYASAVKKIEKAIDLAGRTLGFKLNFEGYEWELISRSSLPDSDISEYIRALIMATEISGLLKLHKLEIQLLGLTQICIAKLPPNNDLESKLICVNLRKALSY